MIQFKILDRYILKGFIPLLLMTFLICWFIVLMQFLWKYVDELVGKGLGLWVIGQTIFYAAMSLVPLALPLGILLASLMFFGQIGERLELLAMKASGMPLYRIMAPLFVTVALLSVALLYFQNTYMITSQVRMWTLLYSARYAKPELEIPERSFYNGIPGYSIYVGKRDKTNEGLMHNLMIYDHKGGREQTRIIRADSGRIVMDVGQMYLTWKLYGGQSFENMSKNERSTKDEPGSYAKERFSYKEIVIAFDANFNMQDESDMRSRFVGKNLAQLNHAIDTATMTIDSIRNVTAQELIELHDRQSFSYSLPSRFDTTSYGLERRERLLGQNDSTTLCYSLDSLLSSGTLQDSLNVYRSALSSLQQMASESEGRLYVDKEAFFHYRTNRQEWHRKFTFPVACLVFFFIGAPLGAIIRKGGLGMPVIVSVGFFIVYYIIDTFGHNMINTENMGVVQGMWISTFVLLPVGVFLTLQATRDSASLNAEAYIIFFRRLLGTAQVRKLDDSESLFTTLDYHELHAQTLRLQRQGQELLSSGVFASKHFWQRLSLEAWVYSPSEKIQEDFCSTLESFIKSLSYSRVPMERAKLLDMPLILPRLLPRLRLQAKPSVLWSLRLISLLLPLSLPIIGLLNLRLGASRRDIKTILTLLGELEPILAEKFEQGV